LEEEPGTTHKIRKKWQNLEKTAKKQKGGEVGVLLVTIGGNGGS